MSYVLTIFIITCRTAQIWQFFQSFTYNLIKIIIINLLKTKQSKSSKVKSQKGSWGLDKASQNSIVNHFVEKKIWIFLHEIMKNHTQGKSWRHVKKNVAPNYLFLRGFFLMKFQNRKKIGEKVKIWRQVGFLHFLDYFTLHFLNREKNQEKRLGMNSHNFTWTHVN